MPAADSDREREDADGLEAALESSLASTELSRIDEVDVTVAFDIAEGLSHASADEVLPEIPVLKQLYALAKAGRSVSNVLLARKIVRFLSQLQSVDAEEREEFLARLEGSDRERIVGDLVLVLDRHEAQRKSEIQGRLFAALIRGGLTTREYLDLTHAVSSVNVDSLVDLKNFYDDAFQFDDQNAQLAYSFAVLQLLGIDNSMIGTYGGGSPQPAKLLLGEKFVGLLD
jgi:hypothetical protein